MSFLFLSHQVKQLLSSSCSSSSSLPSPLPSETKKKKKREEQQPDQQKASRKAHAKKRKEEKDSSKEEEEDKEDLIDGESILQNFKEALETLTGVSLPCCSFYLSSSSLYKNLLDLSRKPPPQSSHEDHLPSSSSSLPLENERKGRPLTPGVKNDKKEETKKTKKDTEEEEEAREGESYSSSSSSSPEPLFDKSLLRASFFSGLHEPPGNLDISALHHLLLLEVEVLLLLSPFLECKKKELTGQRRILHARLVAHNARVLGGGARGEIKEEEEEEGYGKTKKTKKIPMDRVRDAEEENEEVESEREKLDALLKAWNSSARYASSQGRLKIDR